MLQANVAFFDLNGTMIDEVPSVIAIEANASSTLGSGATERALVVP